MEIFPLEHPVGILTVLLVVLSLIFRFEQTAMGSRLFSIVPKLVFCYFVPTTLSSLGLIPVTSELYDWIKSYLLPCSLVLLILSLDLPAIMRLGPRAVIMLLAGTAGVVVGGPLALLIFQQWVPEDTWQGLSALCGSWIGGGANMVALKEIAGTTEEMFGLMVIVDVAVANVWMGVLLYAAARQKSIDAWTGADTSAIDDLKLRVSDFEARTSRIPTLPDLIYMVTIGFLVMWISLQGGGFLAAWIGQVDEAATAQLRATTSPDAEAVWLPFLSGTTWKFILLTAIGVGLSFTRARNLEGAGASKVGSLMLYLLVASIGAHADFSQVEWAHAALLAVGAVWMLVHVLFLLFVAKLIKAPVFFVAVGSQANIGGAASAPIVAGAFHPSLASVGVLLAVAGYVLGTYAGLVCMWLLQIVAGVG